MDVLSFSVHMFTCDVKYRMARTDSAIRHGETSSEKNRSINILISQQTSEQGTVQLWRSVTHSLQDNLNLREAEFILCGRQHITEGGRVMEEQTALLHVSFWCRVG